MKKEELVCRVAAVLGERGYKKKIKGQKKTFCISDGEGNSSNFTVCSPPGGVSLTKADVKEVVDTCIQVIEETLCHGGFLLIKGFGLLELKRRKGGRSRAIRTGEWIEKKDYYAPKFNPGAVLKMCAKIYEMSLDDESIVIHLPDPIDVEDDEDAEVIGDGD